MKNLIDNKLITNVGLLLISLLTLSACDTKSNNATAFLSKGPVTGASCDIYKVVAGAKSGASLATATSNNGTVDFGNITYTGTALISCTGGTYTDEATGTANVAAPAMNSVVTVITGGNYVLSPLTELAFRLATGDNLQSVIATHNSAVATQFGLDGIDITSQQPTDLNTETAGDDAAGKYGSVLAGISQLEKNGSEGGDLAAVLTSLAADLADGNGLDTSTQNNMAAAYVALAGGGSAAGSNSNSDVTNDIVGNVLAVPALANASNQSYSYDSGITTLTFANSGGEVITACTSVPVLPEGLTTTTSSNNSSCEISGTPTAAQSAATYTITATNAAGTDTATVNIDVAKADQAALAAGDDVSKTFGDTSFTQATTGGAGSGTVSYSTSDTGVATVSNTGEVTIIGVGSATITASKAGDANYTGPVTDSFNITVAKADQAALVAGDDVSKTFGDTSFPQAATGGAGTGTVSYSSSDTGVATVSSAGLVTIVGAGSATITASKAGDANYNGPVTGSFNVTVEKAAQAAINAGADVSKAIGEANFTQAATGGSATSSMSYSSDNTSIATVNSTTGEVTLVGVGSTSITASRAPDSNYLYKEDFYQVTVRPQAPTNFLATATNETGAEGNKIAFTWTAPAAGGADTYKIYASTATMVAAQNSDVTNLTPFTPTVTDTGTTAVQAKSGQLPDGTYHFLITTVKNGIESFTSAISVSATLSTNSILADPYIVGAVMYKDTNTNGIFDSGEPVSNATSQTGEFTFSVPLAENDVIRIKEQGMHEGKTFDVDLAAVVAANGKLDVVTPLTTFTSKGLTNQQLADILNHAAQQNIYDNTDGHYISAGTPITVGGQPWSITAAEVSINPLEGDLLNTTLGELTANPRKLIKLQASLTTYALLKIFNGSSALSQYDGDALYLLGYPSVTGADLGQDAVQDGNGHIAVLARNIIKGVTDSLSVTKLTEIETGLESLRGGLIQASDANPLLTTLTNETVLNVVPKVTLDLISKVSVSIVDGLATAGFTACNAENTDNDGNGDVTDDKVRAGLIAYGTALDNLLPQLGVLGSKLYGMKHASSLGGTYKTTIQSFGASTADLMSGVTAAEAGQKTFRFDASNVINPE